ncbi:putative reverse transcriptase domain, reverse transcriptase zinc-binding domain protein [Tanacetum coccineum]
MVSWIMECVSSTSFSVSVNGSLAGYFKGKRGLRQGDPLSPYLFTFVMEILTLILKRKIRESDEFIFHHRCSSLNIINLCFADDLFLFAHGDVNSTRVIMQALDEFKNASGLVQSLPKSTAYFCNVLNHTKLAILGVLPFEEGTLPVIYLGVSLVSTRLVYRDCKELVEKVQMFILPSRIITEIEQLMRGFLWCQGSMRRGKAKVSWESVCLPKNEGGLGIQRLETFNVALITYHIWSILTLKESLRDKWVHTHKLRGSIDIRSTEEKPIPGKFTAVENQGKPWRHSELADTSAKSNNFFSNV